MRRRILVVLFVLVVLGVTGYLWWVSLPQEGGPLTASGTIEAEEVLVASELSGRVAEVLVAKGDTVQAGQVLFRLDDALLQAQREQAQAALEAARARLALAEAQLKTAQLQYEQALQQAHRAEGPTRLQSWTQRPPNEFDLPGWYFTQEEMLEAAQREVEEAQAALERERTNLERLLQTVAGQEFVDVERRLAQARLRFQVADALLEQARRAQDGEALKDYAQSLYDEALNTLQAAQTEYDRLLTTQAAQDILEARARVRVAQERYDAALDRLYALQTGEQALAVRLAQAQVEQARLAVEQARAAVAQAEAQLRLIETQMDKLEVRAPVSGVVTALDIRPGEVVQAAAPVVTLGDLSRLTIRVYVPEDQLGRVRLGDRAKVTVDAFPGETFTATVIFIAQEAEYTPQNVQTAERRKTTVFAVELEIQDPSGRLKPGMPADVTFGDG